MQKTNILRYNSMKILTTSSSAQTIKVIPREYITSGTLSLRNDTTNVDKDPPRIPFLLVCFTLRDFLRNRLDRSFLLFFLRKFGIYNKLRKPLIY